MSLATSPQGTLSVWQAWLHVALKCHTHRHLCCGPFLMIWDTNQASSVPAIFIFFLWKHTMGRWADGCSQRIKGESGSLRADMKHLGNRCHLRDTQSKEVRMQRLALSRLSSATSLSGYTLTAQSVRFWMYKQDVGLLIWEVCATSGTTRHRL